MKTTLIPITHIQTWRLGALAMGAAFVSLASTAFAAAPKPSLNGNNNATGTVGIAFSYQIQATNNPTSYNTSPNPPTPGLTVNTTTGLISGTPTTVGNYSVTLSASNDGGTGTKTVTFKINSGPTSIATISPLAVWAGDTVTLDGTQSHTNPAGGTLDYNWQQAAPSQGTLVIALNPPQPNEGPIETFIAPAPQPMGALSWLVTYTLKVTDSTVAGGAKNTVSDPVTITVYAVPVADAGPDAHVNEGDTAHLSGTVTNPQPGATFSYKWTASSGITLFPSDTAQNPTFTAPQVGPAGQTLTFTLVVTEHLVGLPDKDSAQPDSVTINVDNVNAPPTAYASVVDPMNNPNNVVSMGSVDENTAGVTLYGLGTDPDRDSVTFSWSQVSGPNVALSDNTSSTPTFDAPNLTTDDHVDLVFHLVVNDGQLNSGPSTVTIRVNNTNDPPVAVPTATPASVEENSAVTLDGSGSHDPNGDALTYSWAQTGAPPAPVVTLSGADSQYAMFVAPTVSAQQGQITVTFNLTVDDGQLHDTQPVSVTVFHKNTPPHAIATAANGSVSEGNPDCLDGSQSYDDEDASNVTFAWVQVPAVGEPIVSLDNASTSGPCFTAPDVGPGGATLHFQLTVTDSKGLSSSTTVAVNVTYVNHPPTANAGTDQTVSEGNIVTLNGSGTDPDNNPLKFTWSQFSGPTVTLSDPTDPKATFTAPSVFCSGDVVVMTLTADDDFGGTDSKNVTINIANVDHPPTANAGGNQQVQEGATVALHGTGNDLDTEEIPTLTFQWTQVPQVDEPSVTLSPSSGKDVNFTAPSIGGGDPTAFVELHFSLTVMDTCGGSTTTDPITVHVANIPQAPVAVATGPANANEGGDSVQLDGTGSSDPDLDPLTYSWTQTAGPAVTLVFSPGDTYHTMPGFVTPWVSTDTDVTFKLTVSDPYGFSSDASVTVRILNWNTAPTVVNPRADTPALWPPDHRLVPVHILGVVDPNNNATVTISSVKQDEATNGLGDGDTPVDAFINGDTVQLRAERSGKGNGRVYHIHFTASDPEGSVSGVVTVSVPHDKKTDPAIDGGELFDSTH